MLLNFEEINTNIHYTYYIKSCAIIPSIHDTNSIQS